METKKEIKKTADLNILVLAMVIFNESDSNDPRIEDPSRRNPPINDPNNPNKESDRDRERNPDRENNPHRGTQPSGSETGKDAGEQPHRTDEPDRNNPNNPHREGDRSQREEKGQDGMPPNPNRAEGLYDKAPDNTTLPMDEPAEEHKTTGEHKATIVPPEPEMNVGDRVRERRRTSLDDGANFSPGQSGDAATGSRR